jgi:hypothetical protein
MTEQEVRAIYFSQAVLITNELSNDELLALNLVATLDTDPRNRLFDYEKVSPLFTEAGGLKMHSEIKRALSQIVTQRLSH